MSSSLMFWFGLCFACDRLQSQYVVQTGHRALDVLLQLPRTKVAGMFWHAGLKMYIDSIRVSDFFILFL